MKSPPYVKVLGPGGGYEAVPVGKARVGFVPEGAGWEASSLASGEVLLKADGTSVRIRDLKASTPEEFWLKASAAGLVANEDGAEPLFTADEKEVSRLKDRVRELEDRIRRHKEAAKAFGAESERI